MPSAAHSTFSGLDAEAESAAAVEEGNSEPAKQPSLKIRNKAAPKVDSSLKYTDLCGPAVRPAPAGNRQYCPADCPCRTQRESELQKRKDQMQSIVHALGIKKIFQIHMRSEGTSSVERETEQS